MGEISEWYAPNWDRIAVAGFSRAQAWRPSLRSTTGFARVVLFSGPQDFWSRLTSRSVAHNCKRDAA